MLPNDPCALMVKLLCWPSPHATVTFHGVGTVRTSEKAPRGIGVPFWIGGTLVGGDNTVGADYQEGRFGALRTPIPQPTGKPANGAYGHFPRPRCREVAWEQRKSGQ